MHLLQEVFDSAIRGNLTMDKIGTTLIDERLRELGITLTSRQRAAVQARLKNLEPGELSLNIDLSRKQVAKASMSPEQRVSGIDLKVDFEGAVSRLLDEMPRLVESCVERTAASVLKRLKPASLKAVRERQAELSAFEKRLARRWGRAMDLLAMFREVAVEAGDEFNDEFRAEAAATHDWVVDVLTRLHARACQVAAEVIRLLRSGYADGAHARWRTLHEIAVVGLFIGERGNEVAERYVFHEAIESYKAAKVYQQHYATLGEEPLTEGELERARADRDALLLRFGPAYGEEYGWAADALGNRRPTFSDIERAVNLQNLRPFYKVASHNVHANPKGVFFKLGLLTSEEVLLVGPSDLGLADPGSGALGGHLKTGQSWTGQNRPVGEPPQARVFYRVRS